MIRKVLVDGSEIAVPAESGWAVAEVQPNVWSVLADGRSWEVFSGTDGVMVVNGHRMNVEVMDPRAPRKRRPAGVAEGRQTLKAAMPGKVVRILVAEGVSVAAGEGILIVEAMKMQNEVTSPKPGQVVRISVHEGATVNAGDVLAIVD